MMSKASERLFQIMLNEKTLQNYTFKKLTESQNAREWLIPLKNKGYFDGSKNPPPESVEDQPGFFTMPLWNVLPYLEKVTEENQKNPRMEITNILVGIVDDVINYRNEKGERIDNFRTDWFMTKIIFKLPPEKWKDEHIDFMRIAVKSQFGGDLVESAIGEIMLPALIENGKKDLLLRLLSITLDFKITGKEGRRKIEPIIKKYWIKDALMKHTENITKLCGVEAARIGIGKIKEINNVDTDLLSYLFIPTVEKSPQIIIEDDFVCQLVAFVRDVLEKCSTEDARSLLDEMLKDEISILKRIAIHVINIRYDVIKDMFWSHQENLYKVAKHEVYELLKAHYHELNKAEIDKVIGWSEEIKYPHMKDKEAWKRKELLSAILASENPKVIALYEEYDLKAPGEFDHAGLPVWHETGMVHNISPIEAEKLQEMNNSEIAEYLRDYKQKDTWGLEQISEEGLRREIEKHVSDDPRKYAEDMNAFFDIPAKYQYSIIVGFTKAWQTKKDFSVVQVLGFIEKLTQPEKFWNEIIGGDKKDGYEAWIISRITDFIEEGVKDDEHAFIEECLPQIERLLSLLIEKTPSYVSDPERILDSVLGSPRANVFSATILYALRYARLYKNKDKIRWPESIKQIFTRFLDPAIEKAPDFILTVMRYLPNLLYLDEQWVFKNMPKLFPLKETNRWKIAIEGYLTYCVRVYKKLYLKLREEGHYLCALNTDFGDRDASEKLVQHIAIGFLEGWEDIEDPNSLISILLKNKQASQLSELVSYLGQIREGKPRDKLKGRIKKIWEAIYSIVEKEQGIKEYQKVAAQLHDWLGLIDEIDEEVTKWMKLTAKYIHIQWYEYGLIEELAKHVEKTPQYVGEIYIEMLNTGTCAYPDYKKEDSIKIVETLYMNGQKKLADTICNIYGEAGSYFLSNTYKRYNKEG